VKIICSKCGIIHDEDFAPCKSTLSLPPAEEVPPHMVLERTMAAAAGAGRSSRGYAEPERASMSVAAPEPPVSEPPATTHAEPEWRREVAERLENYRARRRRHRPLDVRSEDGDDSQPLLALAPSVAEASRGQAGPVEDTGSGIGHSNYNSGGISREDETGPGIPVVNFAEADASADAGEYARRRASLRIAARPRRHDRLEITDAHPQFDFSVNETPDLHPQDEQRPVAELRERRLAGLVDGAILGVTCLGFFLLFHALGGEFSVSRFGLAACLASAYLVYAQYFVLFTVFTGVTPGMMLRGLELLSLDGRPPSTRHLLWRSFGYLISAAAVFLGFLWAGWDDDHLTWHDRISQTYMTPANGAASEELAASPQES
jgi:uncharacterized RDD family membrane protein YckC